MCIRKYSTTEKKLNESLLIGDLKHCNGTTSNALYDILDNIKWRGVQNYFTFKCNKYICSVNESSF